MIAMYHCRKQAISRILGWCSIFVIIPIGVIEWITGISFIKDCTGILFAILLHLMAAFTLWFGYIEYSFESRKYFITPEGLYVNKPKKAIYKWDQIYEIGIFHFDAAASLEIYDKIFCCFLSMPPDNIKKTILENKFLYAQKNLHKFVIIDYSEAVKNELSAVYPKKIMDYTIGMNGIIRNKTEG